MKFVKEVTGEKMAIPAAALKLCGFENGDKAELHALPSAAIILKQKMTAMEVIQAMDALHQLTVDLSVHLARASGPCDGCDGDCPFDGLDGQEIALPDYLRDEAGIPENAKLCAYVDEEANTVTIAEAGCAALSAGDACRQRDLHWRTGGAPYAGGYRLWSLIPGVNGMRLDGVEHWDHFQDETIYWLDLSDMPEPIQQAARRIDGKAYNDRCFGICVVHDLATNEYAVVTESGTSPEVDRNIFYVDNDGDKHWFQADLPDTLVKEMFSCCEDVHAGKLLPQGYQALSSVLFDNETGFVSGENQAAKSPFSTWQLRIDHGHPEYYTPHYHTDRESAEQDLNGRVAEYKRYHTIREKNGEFAYLYPYSKAEAGRRGELDRWEESFRANVSCAREIEAAIRGYSSGDGILQPGTARNILEQWGFKRTNFVLANTLQQLGPIKDRLSEANRNWQRGAYIPQDGTNRYFAVDTALICMDQFISQVRDAYKQLELLGPEHCESGSYEKLDYEGRVLVLAPDTLKESYWNQRSQLWLAHDGFGCTPGAIGRSIRCTCLGDGEETRWNRTDFIGVLKEECLPQWAAEALSKLTEGKEQSHTQGGMTMQ